MKKLTVIVLLFVSILYADEIKDVWGRTATGIYLGVENGRIIFKITGSKESNIFYPENIASMTISSTGQKYNKQQILELAGITIKENEPDTKTVTEITGESIYNPCNDELFIKIKQKDLDEMSDREYQYFLQKDKECSEFAKQRKYIISSQQINKVPTNKPESKTHITSAIEDYYIKGSTTAESEFNSNAALGGMLCGFAGGFIGWGIGSVVIQGMDVDIPYHNIKGLETEQQYQFKNGYKETVKKIRKREFNQGAVIGTIGIVVLLLASGS